MGQLDELLNDIDRIAIDRAAVGQFRRKSEYFALAFDLFRETAQYTCVMASVSVGDHRWNVTQAVYGGNLVRLYKLTRFIVEEAVRDRAEMTWVLIRLTAECVVNLQYLIECRSPQLIDSYLFHSLQHERDLRELILHNIEARGGTRLPIEERMLVSIDRTFTNSLVEVDAIPHKKIRNWGDTTFYEKAKAVHLDHAYSAIFAAPSRNVHGGWQDLLQHHLDCKEPGWFSPHLDFIKPQAQPIFALSVLILQCLRAYTEMLAHGELSIVLPRLSDLEERIRMADMLHEEFLAAKQA